LGETWDYCLSVALSCTGCPDLGFVATISALCVLPPVCAMVRTTLLRSTRTIRLGLGFTSGAACKFAASFRP